MNISPSLVFEIANTTALLAWVFLIFLPRLGFTRTWIRSGRLSLAFSALYLVCLVCMSQTNPDPQGSFSSLAGVKAFFSNDWGLLAGWVHYLAFDLLVGAGVLSRMENRHFALRAICLFLTFMFGPVGWALSNAFDRSNKG